jgi:type VI secretion system protein VasJ
VPKDADAGQAAAAVETAALGLRQLARALLGLRLADPRPYQMLRFACWIVLERPPSDTGGKTLLMSPPAERIAYLEDLVRNGQQADAIPQIESSFANALFWLDAQRLTATCLATLGPDYAAARLVVVGALGGLLRRFPGLEGLSFANDVPFASPATRAWIASEVLAGDAPVAAAEPWEAGLNEARKLVGNGNAAGAARLFALGRRQADGERARLLWDLAQGQFCIELGRPTVAAALLEGVDDVIEARGLEGWEPALVAEATRLLLHCYGSSDSVPAALTGLPTFDASVPTRRPEAARLARLRARLARLDLPEALTATAA